MMIRDSVGNVFFLYVQDSSCGGWDYTMYDEDGQELDGGVYDDPDVEMDNCIKESILPEFVKGTYSIEEMDEESFYCHVEEA